MGKRLNLFIRVFIVALLIAGFSLFFSSPGSSLWLVVSAAIAVAIGVIAVVAASRKVASIKTGLPLEDELSKKATWKAGYYAFLAGLWLAICIMGANIFAVEFLKLPEIEFRYAFELLIVVPAFVFIFLSMRFKKQAVVE